MFSSIRTTYFIASLLLTTGFTQAAAISANGTCEVGNCPSPGTLFPGDSIPSTPFSFTYVFANTDRFLVTGTYSASGDDPDISFQATASFLGNSTATSSSADTLSVDLLQNFGYNDDPDGTYTESATLAQGDVAPGSSVSAQLSFGGQGIGLLGPYSGTGSQTFTASKDLSGLTNPSLADFNYTFNLAAGSPATPEPAAAGLLLLGSLLFAAPLLHRRKRTPSVTL